MQKLSETVYSSLFWLISGLMVWLLIVPIALIGFPVIILIKAARHVLFDTPQLNLVETEKKLQTSPENKPANAVEPLLTSLLLKTLIEVPALLAAVISLQPKRLTKGELVNTQTLQPQPPKAQEQFSTDTTDTTDTIEIPAEEKISRN